MTALEDLLSPKAKEELQLRQLREIARQNKMRELLDPVLWIEKNFYIPELMGPLELQPYQKAVLRESQRKDESGKFIYSIVVWSDIKKSAKSTIAAAVALYIAHLRQWASIKIIANDLKQADSRVAYYLRRAIELNPRMVDSVKQVRYQTTIQGNNSVVEAIPVDPGGEAGGNDDLLVFSEMWAAKHKAMEQFWTEMTLSPTKFGYSQRWVETYAGNQGEARILEQLYIQGVKTGKQLDLSYTGEDGRFHDLKDLEVYANGPLLCLWNTKPRCPWQTQEYYCLPLPDNKDDLRVLTSDGWIPAIEVTENHSLCTMGGSGHIEYQNPTSIFKKKYDGDLIHLKHSKAHLRMTPNHRLLCAYASHTRKVSGILSKPFEYEYLEAKDASLKQVGWIPGHGNWKHDSLDFVYVEDEVYDATDFAKLVGWYISEGHVQVSKWRDKEYPSAVIISQDRNVNPEKHKEISALCTSLGLNFKERKTGINIYNSRLARYFKSYGSTSSDKFIPRYFLNNCSREQLKGMLDSFLKGDGTKREFGDCWMGYTNSDQLALDITELAFKCGLRPNWRGSFSSSPETGRLPIHHISLMHSHIGWSHGNQRKHWKYKHFQGDVWCPSVPNGNFYVMQDGVCWWSGNSSEAAVLTPNEFNRVHRNQWTSSIDTFVPPEWWHSCRGNVPELKAKETIVLAMDAGVSDDSFALCGVRKWLADGVDVVYSRRWLPPQGGKISFTNPDNPNDRSTPEGEIRHLCEAYNVVMVAYDPYQLEDMANRLGREGVAWFFPFNQGALRLTADSNLRTLIREKRLRHNGDPDLTEHVLNAGAKTDSEDSRIRIVKRAQHLKTDLCVSLSMAADRINYLLNL